MILVLLVTLGFSDPINVTGVENGDTIIQALPYEVTNDWDLDHFIGLDITIQGETAAYHSEPPFKGVIDMSRFPEGQLEVKFTARFFGNKSFSKSLLIQNLQSAYEQTVHLIQIPVTFDGIHGELEPADFLLRVEGKNEKVSKVWGLESPLEVVILLDTSGSMKERLPIMRAFIKEFLGQLESRDRAKIIGFYHKIYEISDFSDDKELVSKKLLSVRAGGDTNLYGALWAGVKALSKAERRRGILLLTDGRHQMEFSKEEPFQKTLEEGLALAKKHMIPVYILGIGSETDPEVLGQIADGTGGRYFQGIKRKKIRNSFQTFLAELRQQYVLGYYHEPATTGWQEIEINYIGPVGKIKSMPRRIFIQ